MNIFRKLNAYFLPLSLLLLGLTGCEEDIDILAPYEDITTVVGLLDPNDTTHYVKVNRMFVGEDNAMILAQDREDAEYDDISIVVEEYTLASYSTDTNATGRSWELVATEIDDKDSGIFYYPYQTVYTFNATLRQPDFDNNVYPYYKLVITKADGSQVTSWTPLVQLQAINGVQLKQSVFSQSSGWTNTGVPFMQSSSQVNSNIALTFIPPVNTKALEPTLVYSWSDLDADDNVLAARSVEVALGTRTLGSVPTTTSESQSNEIEYTISGQTFYEQIAANVLPILDEPDVARRFPEQGTHIVLELWLAGEELQTFIDLNSPSQTLLEEKPAYSNIKNGVGVWSSRTKITYEFELSTPSADELTYGLELGLTGDRGFCQSADPTDARYCY